MPANFCIDRKADYWKTWGLLAGMLILAVTVITSWLVWFFSPTPIHSAVSPDGKYTARLVGQYVNLIATPVELWLEVTDRSGQSWSRRIDEDSAMSDFQHSSYPLRWTSETDLEIGSPEGSFESGEQRWFRLTPAGFDPAPSPVSPEELGQVKVREWKTSVPE